MDKFVWANKSHSIPFNYHKFHEISGISKQYFSFETISSQNSNNFGEVLLRVELNSFN